MTIAAIVPVWNGRDLLARLMDTLAAQTAPAGDWIVVDNGSTDGAPELARERGARVIPMGRNAGFAAAVNRGIEEARADWIAVLNSDVELAPDYFEKLTASGAPFATGRILDARRNGLLDGTFDLVCRGGAAWRAGSGKPDGPAFAAALPIFSAPWTAAVFRAEVFAKVGRLDERFESYLEDVDFGLRCAAHGIAGRYVPEAVAWHRGSAALGRWHPETVRRITRNQLFLVARHHPARFWWPVLAAQFLWGGLALRHGAGTAWLRGVRQGLARFSDMRRNATAVEIAGILRDNERAIRELQAVAGFDTFWRMYFLLTGGGAK